MARDYKYRLSQSLNTNSETGRYRALIAAVLQRGLVDYVKCQNIDGWIASPSTEPMSFLWCCEALDYNAYNIRKVAMKERMKRLTPEQLLEVVKRVQKMRYHQKNWYKYKNKESLNLAKKAELDVDHQIEKVLGLLYLEELREEAELRDERAREVEA